MTVVIVSILEEIGAHTLPASKIAPVILSRGGVRRTKSFSLRKTKTVLTIPKRIFQTLMASARKIMLVVWLIAATSNIEETDSTALNKVAWIHFFSTCCRASIIGVRIRIGMETRKAIAIGTAGTQADGSQSESSVIARAKLADTTVTMAEITQLRIDT